MLHWQHFKRLKFLSLKAILLGMCKSSLMGEKCSGFSFNLICMAQCFRSELKQLRNTRITVSVAGLGGAKTKLFQRFSEVMCSMQMYKHYQSAQILESQSKRKKNKQKRFVFFFIFFQFYGLFHNQVPKMCGMTAKMYISTQKKHKGKTRQLINYTCIIEHVLLSIFQRVREWTSS